MNRIYYEETYSGFYEVYDVDANSPQEAEEKLIQFIGSGKENAPEECENSVVCAIVGNGDPKFQIMGAKIDALDEGEKTFYLWYLLRHFYKAKLRDDKKKYENDRTTVDQINRLLNNVEELDTLLCYDLF